MSHIVLGTSKPLNFQVPETAIHHSQWRKLLEVPSDNNVKLEKHSVLAYFTLITDTFKLLFFHHKQLSPPQDSNVCSTSANARVFYRVIKSIKKCHFLWVFVFLCPQSLAPYASHRPLVSLLPNPIKFLTFYQKRDFFYFLPVCVIQCSCATLIKDNRELSIQKYQSEQRIQNKLQLHKICNLM